MDMLDKMNSMEYKIKKMYPKGNAMNLKKPGLTANYK
jgi:hypothetical protein